MKAMQRLSKALATIVFLTIDLTTALNIAYCSNQNTGSDFSQVTNQFQSNGACHDTCLAQYAFAVLQGYECWCSNYAPSDTTSTSSCNQECPGFPSDTCGSVSADLFGYIALTISPSGTIGASSSSGSTSSASSTAAASTVQVVSKSSSPRSLENTLPTSFPISVLISTVFIQPSLAPLSSTTVASTIASSTSQVLIPVQTVPASPSLVTVVHTISAPITNSVTVLQTVTASLIQTSLISLTPTAASTTTTLALLPTSSPPLSSSSTTPLSTPVSTASAIPLATSTTLDTSWTPTPTPSVTTITDGEVLTVYLTPTAPPPATTSVREISAKAGGFFSDLGKVLPVFIIVPSAVIAAVCVGIYCLQKRKNQRRQGQNGHVETSSNDKTLRQRLSGFSFGTVAKPRRQDSLDQDKSGEYSSYTEGRIGLSKDDTAVDTVGLMDRRRSSNPLRVVDQRLNPTAVWNPLHDNGSHASIGSFRDDQDYSRRMLRVTNPDDNIGHAA